MKRLLLIALLLSSVILYSGCDLATPDQPQLKVTRGELATSKFVAIGNSLTAGFQSAGMVETAQVSSYPALIAQQLGKTDFQQPLIAEPGIGSTPGQTPLRLENGALVSDALTVNPLTLLKNALLSRPYDNLGVPGATLHDVLAATNAATSNSGTNSFFDMVLRNPNFGNTTQVQQAIMLNPTLIILWIGNNDALGAATAGGDLTKLTDQGQFTTDYTTLLTEIRSKTHAALILANIPYVTDIPFVNTMDIIFRTIPALGITSPVPVVVDATFQPVDFDPTDGVLYLPLLTAETSVEHLTLPALSLYQTGLGVPDSLALAGMGLPAQQASALHLGMIAAGLNPTGQPLPGSVTLTVDEGVAIKAAVEGFNATIATLAQQFQAPVVDMNAALSALNSTGLEGMSGKFVLLDPANTAFSLDGVHPNDAGYAIVANLFIQTINGMLELTVPPLNVAADYGGQYVGKRVSKISLKAARQVQAIF